MRNVLEHINQDIERKDEPTKYRRLLAFRKNNAAQVEGVFDPEIA